MAKPLITFPDPIVVALRVLRSEGFLDVPEVADTGATVSASMPTRTADTEQPSILVALDGDAGSGRYPVSEDALIRVSVWDLDPFRAARLARLAKAHLLAYPGGPDSRGFTRGTVPLTTNDPDDETPISSFLITVRLRAE